MGGLLSLWELGTLMWYIHTCSWTILWFFYGANPDHLRYLHVLFLCFEIVSGLKINLAKSVLVPMSNVDKLVGILGCGVSSLPLK
jgi:hypothetical protein